MSGPGDKFGEDTAKLENVRQLTFTEHLHEYTGVLAETNDRVRIITLGPELADIDAAVDAFAQVSDRWYNASANANILTIRDRGTEPRPWIAVPDHGGDTLATLQPDLSPDAIETVISETADALRTLGLYNTVHGHLSPDDIYLPDASEQTEAPSIHVGGFGLEAAVQASVGEFQPTAYTAPELVDGSAQSSEQTDVYGLGAVIYFALTGQPPVAGTDLAALIRDGPANPPSQYTDGIPADLDDVVMQALSASPASRYESTYALQRAFLNVFDRGDDTGTDDESKITPNDETSTSDKVEQSNDEASGSKTNKEDSSSIVARRTVLSVLGLSAVGGAGTLLLRDQLIGSEQPASTTQTPTPSQTATETMTNPAQQAKLAPDDGDSDDFFGSSVAVSSDGSTALIAANYDEDPNGENQYDLGAGSVYVFDRSGGSWSQQAKLSADDGDGGDKFGESVVLSSDGSTALIGAEHDDDPNGLVAGSAYVFDNSDGSWSQQAKLSANDGDFEDQFGISVALSSDGTTALIGAFIDEDPNGGNAGSAYVFDSAGGSWSQRAKLTANDGDRFDRFGASVALSNDGTTALIGASRDEDPNGDNAGSMYVFEQSEDSWSQQAKLAADNGGGNDFFGNSVAVSSDGSTALIGAYRDENFDGGQTGPAYIFDQSDGSWSQQAELSADDDDFDNQFGSSVAVSSDGSIALIGARRDEDPSGVITGSAYVFDNSGNSWSQQAKLIANDGDSDDNFGESVALSSDGSIALVGANQDEDPNGQESGSAYLFSL